MEQGWPKNAVKILFDAIPVSEEEFDVGVYRFGYEGSPLMPLADAPIIVSSRESSNGDNPS